MMCQVASQVCFGWIRTSASEAFHARLFVRQSPDKKFRVAFAMLGGVTQLASRSALVAKSLPKMEIPKSHHCWRCTFGMA